MLKKILIFSVGILYVICFFQTESQANTFFFGDKSFTAKVVDSDTDKPIEDVLVVVTWYEDRANFNGRALGDILNMQVLRTDANGEFTTKSWYGGTNFFNGLINWVEQNPPVISLLKKGYAQPVYWYGVHFPVLRLETIYKLKERPWYTSTPKGILEDLNDEIEEYDKLPKPEFLSVSKRERKYRKYRDKLLPFLDEMKVWEKEDDALSDIFYSLKKRRYKGSMHFKDIIKKPDILTITKNIDTIKYLLDAGADPNVVFDNNQNPLTFHLRNPNIRNPAVDTDIIKLLMEYGADLNKIYGSSESAGGVPKDKIDVFGETITKKELEEIISNNSDKFIVLHFISRGEYYSVPRDNDLQKAIEYLNILDAEPDIKVLSFVSDESNFDDVPLSYVGHINYPVYLLGKNQKEILDEYVFDKIQVSQHKKYIPLEPSTIVLFHNDEVIYKIRAKHIPEVYNLPEFRLFGEYRENILKKEGMLMKIEKIFQTIDGPLNYIPLVKREDVAKNLININAEELKEKIKSAEGNVVILEFISFSNRVSLRFAKLLLGNLATLCKAYRKNNLVVLPVVNNYTCKDDVIDILCRYRFPYPVYIGDDDFIKELGLSQYSNSYMYQKDGSIVRSGSDGFSRDYTNPQLRELLGLSTAKEDILAIKGVRKVVSDNSYFDLKELNSEPQEKRKIVKEYIEPITAKELQAKLDSLKGKVVILDVFTAHNNDYNRQIKELIKVYNTYSTDDIVIIGVDVTLGTAENYKPYYNVPYKVYDGTFDVAKEFHVYNLTEVIIYDQAGIKIPRKITGFFQAKNADLELARLSVFPINDRRKKVI